MSNVRQLTTEVNNQAMMSEEGGAKKKKKKKKSIVEADGEAENGEGAPNGVAAPKKKKKKKLKKAQSESALVVSGGDDAPVKKKKKKKKKVSDFGGDTSDDNDDDDFLPDSPLKGDDGPRKVLRHSTSLGDGGSNHSTDFGDRGPMRGTRPGRGGMMRAQSVNFGGRGGMARQSSVRNALNTSGHGGPGRGMGMRQGSRGGGLSVSEHGGRGGRGMGMRQPSRGGGLSVSEHGGRSGRGMGMRQPSWGGGLSVSEHGGRGGRGMGMRQPSGRGMGMRQPSRRLSGSEHGPGRGRGMGMRQPSRRLSGSEHGPGRGRGMGNRQSSMRQSNRFSGGAIGRQPSARIGMDGHIEESSVAPSVQSGRGRPSLADNKRSMSKQSMSLSTRSFDMEEFDNEPKWKQFLRYLHCLQPTPWETPIQRKQRYLIWSALALDFIAAMVAIFTYDEATRCCEVPIFDTASAAIDWDLFIRVTTYIYTALLFIEVIPVLKKGLPINLVNPVLGFAITFGMFFDDRIIEAIMMWLIEASAIGCEVVVFFLVRKEYQMGNQRIEDATTEIEKRKPKSRKKLNRGSSKTSWDDDIEDGPNADLKYLDNFRLERERRKLKVEQTAEAINLRYHLIGTAINCGLVVLSLSLIAGIGSNGGLCIHEMESPPIFASNQKQRCFECFTDENRQNLDIWDEDGFVCQICDPTDKGKHTCYFGYTSAN